MGSPADSWHAWATIIIIFFIFFVSCWDKRRDDDWVCGWLSAIHGCNLGHQRRGHEVRGAWSIGCRFHRAASRSLCGGGTCNDEERQAETYPNAFKRMPLCNGPRDS
jgi:hypothetical protein